MPISHLVRGQHDSFSKGSLKMFQSPHSEVISCSEKHGVWSKSSISGAEGVEGILFMLQGRHANCVKRDRHILSRRWKPQMPQLDMSARLVAIS